MKKTRFFLVLAGLVAVLTVVLMAACGNGTTEASNGNDDPLVYSDIIDGKVVEITVSRTDLSRAVLTPRAGDYYVIKSDGVVVSKGRVTKVVNGEATFTPDADSPGGTEVFTGTFGTGILSIPRIPIEGGTPLDDFTAVPAAPDAGGTGAPELSAAMDTLLRKYTWSWQQPDPKGNYEVYYLDPARFKELKAKLDGTGEYSPTGSSTGVSEGGDRGVNCARWIVRSGEVGVGSWAALLLHTKDNSTVVYDYKKDVVGTKVEELLRTYMAPRPEILEDELYYNYPLDPARFTEFKAELDAGDEYFVIGNWDNPNREWDLGVNFALWRVLPNGEFELQLNKEDNSSVGYFYEK